MGLLLIISHRMYQNWRVLKICHVSAQSLQDSEDGRGDGAVEDRQPRLLFCLCRIFFLSRVFGCFLRDAHQQIAAPRRLEHLGTFAQDSWLRDRRHRAPILLGPVRGFLQLHNCALKADSPSRLRRRQSHGNISLFVEH